MTKKEAQTILGAVIGGLANTIGLDEVREIVTATAECEEFWIGCALMLPDLPGQAQKYADEAQEVIRRATEPEGEKEPTLQ